MLRESTRRSFLKITGASMAAVAARPRAVLGANDRINVGVIGIGVRGSELLRLALARRNDKHDLEVVALCDPYQRRLTRAAERAPDAKTYLHHQDLLARRDVDAVFIATPDHWHAPITLLAMDSGKDVYCEKPMTHTVEEAKQVAAKSRQTNKLLQVGVQGTSWDRWHKIHDIIQAGTIGSVVALQGTYSRNDPAGDWNWPIDATAGPDGKGDDFIDWKQWIGPAPARAFDADRFFRFRKYWDYSGGIATDLHYHIVAPFHIAVRNDHPTRVSGMGGLWVYDDGREVPDTFLTAADYPGKYSLTVQSSQVNSVGPDTIIRGTRATIHMGDEWETRQTDRVRIAAEQPYREEFLKKYGTEELVIGGMGNQGDRRHVDNFIDCIRTRQQPNCNADVGYKVMTAIGLSVRSCREGKTFYFDADKEQVTTRS